MVSNADVCTFSLFSPPAEIKLCERDFQYPLCFGDVRSCEGPTDFFQDVAEGLRDPAVSPRATAIFHHVPFPPFADVRYNDTMESPPYRPVDCSFLQTFHCCLRFLCQVSRVVTQ